MPSPFRSRSALLPAWASLAAAVPVHAFAAPFDLFAYQQDAAPAVVAPGSTVRFQIDAAELGAPAAIDADVTTSIFDPSGSEVGTANSAEPLVIQPLSIAGTTTSYAVPATGAAAGTWHATTTVRDRATGTAAETGTASFTVSAESSTGSGMTQTLDETFSGGSLDTSIWSAFYPANQTFGQTGWLKDEAEILPEGGLRLRADRRTVPLADGTRDYASGVVSSFGGFSQTYGYFEITASMPPGAGLWPAFWLLPTDQSWPPEIDIVEWLGRDPGTVYTTLHYPTDATGGRSETDGSCDVANLTGQMHRYGLAWRPGSLTWSVDGQNCFATTGATVPDKPMYILANLAVGASDSWGGAPDASTAFPANFDVAAIRVWQYDDLATAAPAPAAVSFGKTMIDPVAPSAGGSAAITTSVHAGTAALNDVEVQATIFAVNSSQSFGTSSVATAATIAAGGTSELGMTLPIPASLPTGFYDVAININAGHGSINQWQWVGQRFHIGSLPPLPPDNAPFP